MNFSCDDLFKWRIGLLFSGRLYFTKDFHHRGNNIFQLFLRRDLGWVFNQPRGTSAVEVPPSSKPAIQWQQIEKDTNNETNDKNNSKDNPEDDSSTKSNCIARDNTPFLFSFGFILANSRRNHKGQEQNSSNFHFDWRTFSIFRSCWLFFIEFQVMPIFNAFWFDGKNVMQFYLAKKYVVQFRISWFFLQALVCCCCWAVVYFAFLFSNETVLLSLKDLFLQ